MSLGSSGKRVPPPRNQKQKLFSFCHEPEPPGPDSIAQPSELTLSRDRARALFLTPAD